MKPGATLLAKPPSDDACSFRTALGAAGAIACFGAGLLACSSSSASGNGTPTPCTVANVQLIQASNYDQSCNVDSDCLGVAEGDACYPCLVLCGVGGAINRGALAKYQDDVSKTTGFQELSNAMCECPNPVPPCCRAGICHADAECPGAIPKVPPLGAAAVDAAE